MEDQPQKLSKKLQKELGSGTWDAGCGLCPHMSGQKNDLIVVKLQSACGVDSGFQVHNQHTSFWSIFDRYHIETLEKFKDDPNHEFREEEIGFDLWMELYSKHK